MLLRALVVDPPLCIRSCSRTNWKWSTETSSSSSASPWPSYLALALFCASPRHCACEVIWTSLWPWSFRHASSRPSFQDFFELHGGCWTLLDGHVYCNCAPYGTICACPFVWAENDRARHYCSSRSGPFFERFLFVCLRLWVCSPGDSHCGELQTCDALWTVVWTCCGGSWSCVVCERPSVSAFCGGDSCEIQQKESCHLSCYFSWPCRHALPFRPCRFSAAPAFC